MKHAQLYPNITGKLEMLHIVEYYRFTTLGYCIEETQCASKHNNIITTLYCYEWLNYLVVYCFLWTPVHCYNDDHTSRMNINILLMAYLLLMLVHSQLLNHKLLLTE